MFLDKSWLEPPKVFISSTVRDESKVYRNAITEDLKKMGLQVKNFQDNTFPYGNDTKDIIPETIEAVHTADVFLLLIGDKCGSLYNEKPVIQCEYEEACKYNLPIFVFIEKETWSDYQKKRIGDNNKVENQIHYDFIKAVSKGKISEFDSHTACVEHIKSQFNNHLGGYFKFAKQTDWLWGEYATRQVESNANEIWIITPDFYWDFEDKDFKNIVKNNILRGCIYRYIYKGSQKNKETEEEMTRKYKQLIKKENKDNSLMNNIYFLSVPENNFMWATEQILFNPFDLKEEAIMVDIMNVKDKSLKFNIAFGEEKRRIFRNQFISFWNENQNEEGQKIKPKNYE